MRRIAPEDMVRFGMIPEFIGRLPVVTVLDQLKVDGPREDPAAHEERDGEAVLEALRHGRGEAPVHLRRREGGRR